MSGISLQNLTKVFPNGTRALEGINLEVKNGEFLVLVGPSGCGKTTLLRIISGLDNPTEGVIKINQKEVNHLAPKERDLGMVFQNYALYPHLSVRENIAFGLVAQKSDSEVIKKNIRSVAKKLELSELLDRRPDQLSGGQKQRVALGRLLARNPSIHLLDEPLSNLDANLRTSMRVQLAELHREFQKTTLFVTHDQVEAMTLGQRLCVMNHGKIIQIGTPTEIYQCPKHQFVAEFFGFPNINIFNALLSNDSKNLEILPGIYLQTNKEITPSIERVNLGIRPEDWSVKPDHQMGYLEANLKRIENLGDSKILHFIIGEFSIMVKSTADNLELDSNYFIHPDWEKAHWFEPVSGNRISM
jgi:multiple sugar transport system ATP-binding protein